jgi:N-acetylmuramoyl-L-alanine amidase
MIIGIDPGHGLNTLNKRTPVGYKEAEFNYPTALYLETFLFMQEHVPVLTVSTRTDEPLASRIDKVNSSNCEALISIHYNAVGECWQSYAKGIEIFYHEGSERGKRLAVLVNNSIAFLSHKKMFADGEVISRGVKKDTSLFQNGLAILRNTKPPAILIECGFMDHKQDAKRMKSNDYRKMIALAISYGIQKYRINTI